MTLEAMWYVVIGASVMFYVILDGFDLGVGALHLLAKDDHQRRLLLNSIGPVWDGNEVWIVIVVGGLFAGFPDVYASLLSGFYTLIMVLLMGLMFRAAAIEFRSKHESKGWRSLWDGVFSLASILVAFLLGLMLGNVIQGIPLDATQDFVGTFSDFFRPYSILVGITAIALFSMHGSIYLAMKTEGEAHDLVRRWILPSIFFFFLCYLATTIATIIIVPHMTQFLSDFPLLIVVPILALIAIINVPYQIRKKQDGWAFISSSVAIILLLSLFAFGTFPILVLSTLEPQTHSLTIYNTASSHSTLKTLLIFAAIGIPLILCYGFFVYRTFRGKVKLDRTSY